MKKGFSILALLMSSMLINACGVGFKARRKSVDSPNPPVTATPPAVVSDPIQDDIKSVLSDENSYRDSLGQTELSAGLGCTVQQIASGQRISSSSPAGLGAVIAMTGSSYGYLYKGSFSQPDSTSGASNLIPTAIQPLFVGLNYLVRCQGQIVVLKTDYYQFDLNSDDGSLLYLDGATVVNDDGNHGMTLVSGVKMLRRGVHTFRVDYAQTGGGNFGLVLRANGSAIDPMFYAH